MNFALWESQVTLEVASSSANGREHSKFIGVALEGNGVELEVYWVELGVWLRSNGPPFAPGGVAYSKAGSHLILTMLIQ